MLASINFHLYKPCDAKCDFCFATFRNIHGHLKLPDALRLLDLLRATGCEKINFAGGEPTLHPHIVVIVEHAKALGLVTGVVTNGARLERLLDACPGALDWAALSIDSADEAIQAALGRGRGDHIRRAIALSDLCRTVGVRVKLNTVVTALNAHEDASALVRRVAPERWKVFQVLPIDGQNDGKVEPLLITREVFAAYLRRHAHLAAEGFPAIAEDNDAMTDSYVMIDPLGRFFGNTGGQNLASRPILEVGIEVAFAEVQFNPGKFEARGGRYAW